MNPGYDPHHSIPIGIPVHDNTHMKWEDRAQYFEQIRASIAELPEVVDRHFHQRHASPQRYARDL